MTRLVLAGAKEILNKCILALLGEIDIAAIYTPPKNELLLKEFLEKNNLDIQYKTIDMKKDYDNLRKLSPDMIISIQYKYRINQETIELVDGRCFNLHFSLLPR